MFTGASQRSPAVLDTSPSPPTPGGENPVGITVMLGGSIVLSLILVLSNGNAALGLGFVAVLAVVLITFYRLDWGFYIFVFSFLVFDNTNLAGFDPWTYKVGYMVTLNVLVPGLGVGALTPMEIHLLFLIFVWVLLIVVKRDLHVQRTSLPIVPGILFFLWLIVMTMYGIATGGDAMKALWDIRAMLYLLILFFFVPNIITSRQQLHNILWIIVGSLTFKAVQAAIRLIENGFSFGQHRAMGNHEDPILMGPLFLFLFCMVTFGSRSKQRSVLWVLLLPLLLGYYAANRRAAYVALLVCIVAFIVLLTPRVRSKAIKILLPLSFVFGVYLIVFWNSPSAQFAQAVKSAVITDPAQMRRDDYLSGLARDQENYNLAVTLRRLPFGLGFGKKHDFAIHNWGSFSLRGYITHNQILWLLVKSGPIGFFLFLFFLNSVLFHSARVFSRLRDPYMMALCAMCIIAILNQIVAAYVDMGFTRFRAMAYLGLLLGMFPALERSDQEIRKVK